MIVVVDASLALSWMFADEQTPLCMGILQQVSRTGAVVPTLWRLEMANSLQTAVRRRRIDATYRDSMIEKLLLLPIEIDSETNEFAWTTTLHLAAIHRVTVYDASYLELTIRRSLPLATRDDQLAAAAVAAGATLLPTR